MKLHACFMHGTMVPWYICTCVCTCHTHVLCKAMLMFWTMHGSCMNTHESSFHAWNMHEIYFHAWNVLKHAWNMHESSFHAWNVLKHTCFRCSILSRGLHSHFTGLGTPMIPCPIMIYPDKKRNVANTEWLLSTTTIVKLESPLVHFSFPCEPIA